MSRVVVAMGHGAVNYLGLVSRLPDPDEEEAEIAAFSQQGGGSAATAAATLAYLGAPTRFVGKVADDHFGDFIRLGLDSLGVDLEHIVVEHDKVSPFTYIAVEVGTGRRTLHRSRGNVSDIEESELDFDGILKDAAALVIDGTQPHLQMLLAVAARERGISVVWDAGSGAQSVGEMLGHTDVIIASERLAMEIAPASELDESLAKLCRLGPTTSVITLGPEGAMGLERGGEPHRETALDVEVVDTTGAGHVYCGAFVYAMTRDWPLARAMRFSGVAAGMHCRHLGPRAGIPTLDEILETMESVDH